MLFCMTEMKEKASIIRNKFDKDDEDISVQAADGQSEKELLEIAAQTWERRKIEDGNRRRCMIKYKDDCEDGIWDLHILTRMEKQ